MTDSRETTQPHRQRAERPVTERPIEVVDHGDPISAWTELGRWLAMTDAAYFHELLARVANVVQAREVEHLTLL